MKVAFLGAGSFVFGPSFLADALIDSALRGIHLALVEPNPDARQRMTALAEAFAPNVQATISSHADYHEAVDGADFVVSAAAVQMHRRFEREVEIIRRHDPEHMITEFGGIHGISYSLRQIAFHVDLARAMRRQCPKAWLLTVANPLPRVVGAVEREGVRCAGFCSVSLVGYRQVWELLHGKSLDYPFEVARTALRLKMGGTNHLSWLTELEDAQTGEDLMPRLRERAARDRGLSEKYLRETGFLLMSGDEHIRDFLAPTPGQPGLEHISHGGDKERLDQEERIARVTREKANFGDLLAHRAWEHPMWFIEAMAASLDRRFTSINLRNDGQIPNLPIGAIVETAAAGADPEYLVLPEEVQPLSLSAVKVSEAILDAAQSCRLSDVDVAIELDRTILDKSLGRVAIRECIEANTDLIGTFS